MRDAYIIEVEGRTAGIVARDSEEDSFGFFAAARPFDTLEGQCFPDPSAAEYAARHLARHGSLPRRADSED
jgi:hypothetical protein